MKWNNDALLQLKFRVREDNPRLQNVLYIQRVGL